MAHKISIFNINCRSYIISWFHLKFLTSLIQWEALTSGDLCTIRRQGLSSEFGPEVLLWVNSVMQTSCFPLLSRFGIYWSRPTFSFWWWLVVNHSATPLFIYPNHKCHRSELFFFFFLYKWELYFYYNKPVLIPTLRFSLRLQFQKLVIYN